MIRHLLSDGSATDVIGWLEEIGHDEIGISPGVGSSLSIRRDRVITARRAPAAAGGGPPLRVAAEDLEQAALTGWLAEHAALGEWTLRAGGGFTGRANSCLAVGDPGCDVADAAEVIVSWSAEHGIEPRAQVIAGSSADRALIELGWRQTYVTTDVMVARLAGFLGSDLPSPEVRVTETFEASWLAAYHRSRPNDADPAILELILAGNPPRAFASFGPAEPTAIARGHVSGPWLGLAAIWVAPERRRHGLATAMMRALGHWGARRGARWVYLQVAAANTTAVAAYERLGFQRHHAYRYVRPASTAR
ncbi:MAG TPA: GNAT family N-acetyltransferase [Microlunatus sp.]|nr:GNAT family N-acetyltransferase [Microlunatus sp.]